MPDEINSRQDLLNQLPGMPALLNHPEIRAFRESHPALYVNDLVRRELDALRQTILDAPEASLPQVHIDEAQIARRALDLIRRSVEPSLNRAINAAGVILHTALGRAPLAESVREAVALALTGYTTLAINLVTGKRGDRHLHTDRLLAHLTGAESGLIVNNNAAATMLILNTIAAGKEVIVSRGQLVEIGGAFRIPDVLKRSGCQLVEVGTTNRTHLRDYENAITPQTALLLRVHMSNYRIVGFTAEVLVRELVDLGRKKGIPVVDDIGSGALVDMRQFGLPEEPLVQDSVKDGADLVCFSGDKMLGGPQCGIIVGKRELIERIKRNPLTRALRCDKMTYAAVEATLKLYLEPEKLQERHPVLAMITASPEAIKRRAQLLKRRLSSALKDKAELSIMGGETEMGSGSMPAQGIPTFLLRIKPRVSNPDDLAQCLRLGNPAIFVRIADGALLLDLRTVFPEEERILAERLVQVI